MDDTLQECYKYYIDLRGEMDRWLKQSMALDPPGPNSGGEDEANYTLAWFPHYLVTGDETVLKHFGDMKSALAGWVERECLHGYEPEAEAHHGTEPFLLFLPRYIELVPDDQEARSMLIDAAEHIGNWVEEIPAWYDYDRDTFYGYHIGSRTVQPDAETAYELAEHFRFIHIALAAYRITGEQRYLDWSLRYGRKRAERIVDAESPMPLLWDLAGNGLGEAEVEKRNLHRIAAHGTHHLSSDPLAGIENLLASGAIYALGDLYHLSGDTIFRDAAKRIVEPLVESVLDPYHDPAAAAISYYRWTFGDTAFDQWIRDQLDGMLPVPRHLALIFPQEVRRREPGVGRRADMAYWGEWSNDGSVQPIREPSTAAMTLAYQITGNPEFAIRAFRSASTRLTMARRVLRGGREHADMGGAVCSVAAGHGRNWGHGAVTSCYGPLLLGTREIQSAVIPTLEMRTQDGKNCLPRNLLSLIRPPVDGQGDVIFYNGGDSTLSFSWQPKTDMEAESDWKDLCIEPGEVERVSLREK